jgi:hypothetical protein
MIARHHLAVLRVAGVFLIVTAFYELLAAGFRQSSATIRRPRWLAGPGGFPAGHPRGLVCASTRWPING